MNPIPVVLATLAALVFAVGNNLQRHGAAADEHAHLGPVALVWHLLRSPIWLAGSACALVGLGLHAAAFRFGGLIVVQSVLASTFVFALLIEAAVDRERIPMIQIIGSIGVVIGIVLLVGIGKPGEGGIVRHPELALVVLAFAVIAAVGALAVSHRWRDPRRIGIAMGWAAGTCFSLDAVFLRGLTSGWGHETWLVVGVNVLGFVVCSVLGNMVLARGFQRAPLRFVLPALAATEPVTAFVAGRVLFHEHLAPGRWVSLAVTVGLGLMVVGVIACASGQAHLEAESAAHKPSTDAVEEVEPLTHV